LSEFDFDIPLSSKSKPDSGDGEDSAEAEGDEIKKLESDYVLKSLLTAQQQDLVDFTKSTAAQRSVLARMEMEIDKTLLQMMAVECREGEERGMRALEMVTLMRDRTGRMIEAAGKVASRYGRSVLEEKIREVGESRLLVGMEED
jgi:chromosome transmission fidelity protein 4